MQEQLTERVLCWGDWYRVRTPPASFLLSVTTRQNVSEEKRKPNLQQQEANRRREEARGVERWRRNAAARICVVSTDNFSSEHLRREVNEDLGWSSQTWVSLKTAQKQNLAATQSENRGWMGRIEDSLVSLLKTFCTTFKAAQINVCYPGKYFTERLLQIMRMKRAEMKKTLGMKLLPGQIFKKQGTKHDLRKTKNASGNLQSHFREDDSSEPDLNTSAPAAQCMKQSSLSASPR